MTQQKQFNRFESFRKVIDTTDDLEMMKICQGLLRDIITINDMQENLDKMKGALYEEQKRAFYSFFVDDLPPVEVAALADKVTGRVKVLERKAEKEAEKKEKESVITK